MSDKLNIHQRMHKVMQDVSYIQKDSTINNQYTAVTHDAVTAKTRTAFIEHGILAIPTVINHEQDGNRTTATVEIEYINIDNPTDKITVTSFGYGIDKQDKGPGKAISYAVKYGHLKALGLETGDDPERDNIDFKEDPKEMTKEDYNKILGHAKKAKITQGELTMLIKWLAEELKCDTRNLKVVENLILKSDFETRLDEYAAKTGAFDNGE